MTSRQAASPQKMSQEKDNGISSPSDTAPAVPSHVVYKLLAFTAAMVAIPIGSYFATVDAVFGGNATFAGGLAAFMANVVLVAYVIVAVKEDQGEKHVAEEMRKKAQ